MAKKKWKEAQRPKPEFWKSLKTGTLYIYEKYCNWGTGKPKRGKEDLKNLYEELGITKSVTGHFHESGHRANDSSGNHVKEGDVVKELFWNSGCLDNGQMGILIVKGSEVSYRNLNL